MRLQAPASLQAGQPCTAVCNTVQLSRTQNRRRTRTGCNTSTSTSRSSALSATAVSLTFPPASTSAPHGGHAPEDGEALTDTYGQQLARWAHDLIITHNGQHGPPMQQRGGSMQPMQGQRPPLTFVTPEGSAEGQGGQSLHDLQHAQQRILRQLMELEQELAVATEAEQTTHAASAPLPTVAHAPPPSTPEPLQHLPSSSSAVSTLSSVAMRGASTLVGAAPAATAETATAPAAHAAAPASEGVELVRWADELILRHMQQRWEARLADFRREGEALLRDLSAAQDQYLAAVYAGHDNVCKAHAEVLVLAAVAAEAGLPRSGLAERGDAASGWGSWGATGSGGLLAAWASKFEAMFAREEEPVRKRVPPAAAAVSAQDAWKRSIVVLTEQVSEAGGAVRSNVASATHAAGRALAVSLAKDKDAAAAAQPPSAVAPPSLSAQSLESGSWDATAKYMAVLGGIVLTIWVIGSTNTYLIHALSE